MHKFPALLLLAFVVVLGACTRSEQQTANNSAAEARQEGREAGQAAANTTDKARELGREIGEKAREAEVRTRDERAQLKEGAKELGKDIKRGTQELAQNAGAAAAGAREGYKEAKTETAGAGNAAEGATLYASKCAACHGADAAGRPTMKAPSVKGVDAAKIKSAMAIPRHSGVKNLTDAQIANLAAYLKSL